MRPRLLYVEPQDEAGPRGEAQPGLPEARAAEQLGGAGCGGRGAEQPHESGVHRGQLPGEAGAHEVALHDGAGERAAEPQGGARTRKEEQHGGVGTHAADQQGRGEGREAEAHDGAGSRVEGQSGQVLGAALQHGVMAAGMGQGSVDTEAVTATAAAALHAGPSAVVLLSYRCHW